MGSRLEARPSPAGTVPGRPVQNLAATGRSELSCGPQNSGVAFPDSQYPADTFASSIFPSSRRFHVSSGKNVTTIQVLYAFGSWTAGDIFHAVVAGGEHF